MKLDGQFVNKMLAIQSQQNKNINHQSVCVAGIQDYFLNQI